MPSVELGAQDVHVWQVDLDAEAGDSHFRVLSRDEHAKAERFATRELQLHYRRCRSALRMLLAKYLQQAAAGLRFEYNRFGKPALADRGWHFNLSHSGRRALVAIARQPLGIDLEMLDKPGIDVDELVGLVCHPTEKAVIEALSAAERQRLFYRTWTRKEAYCKALGVGLQRELPTLRMETHPTTAAVEVIDGQATGGPAYYVHDLHVVPGHAASLCLPLEQARIGVFTYSGQEAH